MMRAAIGLAVIAGCSGGGAKPTEPVAPAVTIDAALAAAIPPATPDAAVPPPPDAPDPAPTIPIELSQCPTAPVDGVARGMSYDCGAFSVRDVTSPERILPADLIASLRQKSEDAGAQVAETETAIAGADAAIVLVHTDGGQVSLDVVALHDPAPHRTRIVVCTAPWMDPAERDGREAACVAAISTRLAQPGFPARKLSKQCTKAAAHVHDLLAGAPAPGPESATLTIAADFLINCTDPLAKCAIKATTPDALIECYWKSVPKPS